MHVHQSDAAGTPFSKARLAVAAFHGKTEMDLDRFEDAADLLGALSMMHGLAHLVLVEKVTHLFDQTDTRDFVNKVLPGVLARMYPSRDRHG